MSEIYFKRTICFCNKRITKTFSCDWFQIIPLETYINSEIKTNHFPFILEYKVNKENINYYSYEDILDNSEDSTKKMLSEMNSEYFIMIYILKLLSTITNFYFFSYNSNDQGWFVNLDGKTEDDLFCKYGVKIYFDKKLKDKMFISEFSKVDIEEMELQNHSNYFTAPDIDNENNGEVTLGHHTALFFDLLNELDDLQKQYFDSAITLIYNGQDIREKMKSLAFLAFISSIETMTTLEGKLNGEKIIFECNSCQYYIKESNYNCKKCGKPIWGISQKIKLYLEKYLSKDERFKTVINKLYGRRSKIAHTGNLLSGDLFFDWDNPKERENQNNELIAAMQYSKMSIINYVLINGTEKREKVKNTLISV
ncbi:hypothetical protein BWK63_13070 [Flavobacterium covae]|uniref:HEPN domain-containing protein n=1 Tax=Flavobacterium covae TaxID=2906076 RepID=A0ABW8PGA0_9FLAO|nr:MULTISPECIES: HEPN domain-containing protein [Flavobacterium]OWP80055.1 hypothetical protein BWK63_13070 [Flavobacterium covae]POR19703.1 hypothetical protein BWK57_13480 [Flavobacterium columnare]